jgi:S-phase kinase-associated protein 1
MEKVIEWCTHHKSDPPSANDDGSRYKSTDVEKWDRQFMLVNNTMLFDIIQVRLVHYGFCHTFVIIAD